MTRAVNVWNLWGCCHVENDPAPCDYLTDMPLWSGDTQKLMVTQFVKNCVAIEILGLTSCCCMNYFTTGTAGLLVKNVLVNSVMMWSWLEVLRKSGKTFCEDICSGLHCNSARPLYRLSWLSVRVCPERQCFI